VPGTDKYGDVVGVYDVNGALRIVSDVVAQKVVCYCS